MNDWLDDAALDGLEQRIDGWLHAARGAHPAIVAIDRGAPGERRWYVRMAGEAKEFTTVWLHLGQRTLRYETYVMPAPEENVAAVYESVLRRNERLVGAWFSIGGEDAIYLRGAVPVDRLDERAIDGILGTLYQTVERAFPSLIRAGFASRFAD